MAPPEIVAGIRKMQEHNSRIYDLYNIFMGIKTDKDHLFITDTLNGTADQGIIIAVIKEKGYDHYIENNISLAAENLFAESE
jgi:hypothetical protein